MDGGYPAILGRRGIYRRWCSIRGCECPIGALAEYVLNTINLGLDPRSKITWDDVVTRTPWLTKQLHGMTAAQEMTVKHQALPVPGESSELEVVLEKRYSEQLLCSKGRGKLIAENPTAPGHKPITSCPPQVDQSRARRHPQATPEEGQRGRMEC